MQGNGNPVNSIWNCTVTVTVTVEALNVSDQWWIFFPATVNDRWRKKLELEPKILGAAQKKLNR